MNDVIAYCPNCKKATFHIITKRDPLCKECLAKNSIDYVREKLKVPDNRKHEGAVCANCGGSITESEYSYGASGCCDAAVVPEEEYGKPGTIVSGNPYETKW